MRTLLGVKMLTLSAGALVAIFMATGPATAEDGPSNKRVATPQDRTTTVDTPSSERQALVRQDQAPASQNRQQQHLHGRACYSRWVPAGYDIVTERVWMPASSETTVVPWQVEWTWHAYRGHYPHLVRITDDHHTPPRRPSRRHYGRGGWERHILQEGYVRDNFVPAHWDTVERKVHRPGRYTLACGY